MALSVVTQGVSGQAGASCLPALSKQPLGLFLCCKAQLLPIYSPMG